MEEVLKDWTGNRISTFVQIGASNHSERERESHDFYATDPGALSLLAEHCPLPHFIWEPCCGMGHLSKCLEDMGHDVCSTDLIDRGYGSGGVNFFEQDVALGCSDSEDYAILTNPPFRYANDFVLHALDLLRDKQHLILLLKTTFLEGSERYERIFGITPPLAVYQHVKRIGCALNGDFASMPTSAMSYAWFVWEKGFVGETKVRWLYPSKSKAVQLRLF